MTPPLIPGARAVREIVLQLNAPKTWVSEITTKHPSTIRILDCKPAQTKDGLLQLVEVTAPQEELEQVVEEVKENPLVSEAYIVKTGKGKMLGSLLTQSVICRTMQGTNAFCRTCLFHATPKPDGTVEWTIAFTGRESLTELLDGLKETDVNVKILRLSSIADSETLTERQRSIIETALEEGYFDYPRRLTLRQLAKKVGISASTLSEVLRRAEKKILSSTYGETDSVQGILDSLSAKDAVRKKN